MAFISCGFVLFLFCFCSKLDFFFYRIGLALFVVSKLFHEFHSNQIEIFCFNAIAARMFKRKLLFSGKIYAAMYPYDIFLEKLHGECIALVVCMLEWETRFKGENKTTNKFIVKSLLWWQWHLLYIGLTNSMRPPKKNYVPTLTIL